MPLTGEPVATPVRISDILRARLESKPDDPALVSRESRWTWRELDEASSRYAANLVDLGVRPGDRIASLMPNRNVLLIHYLACAKAGFAATPLNYRYMPPEIDHALEVSEPAALVAHAERDEHVGASKLAGRLRLGVIRYAAADGRTPKVEELIERKPPRTEIRGPAPEDPAIVFFTSGSTGKPKGVTHSFETLGWVVASCAQAFRIAPGDAILPGSSISHAGGFTFALSAFARGARVLLARTFDGAELLPLLREQRPSVLFMLPAALIALARDHGATREDFASVRLCVSGGDKVPAELEREFTDLAGFPIDEGYGMSEIGMATLNPVGGRNKIGSVGTATPGFSLSIRADDGGELPPGGERRLWVRSRSNMVGYWGNPKATKETFRDGWLDTGDVMKADADGYLSFCGRRKQIIVHDGSNICPQEVEEALLEHGAVSSAGVVGVHDLLHGENVRAYVTLIEGAPRPTMQELIEFARERVGYKAPEVIEVLAEMPENATGKVDRVFLKRLAAQAHG